MLMAQRTAPAKAFEAWASGGVLPVKTIYSGICFVLAILLLPPRVLADSMPRTDCINNLRHLAGAKEALALEDKLKPGDPVQPDMLKDYLYGGKLPKCLAGGVYTIGPIGVDPVCSVAGHSEAALRRDMERQARNERILVWLLVGFGSAVAAWAALAIRAARKHRNVAADPSLHV